MCLSRCKSRRSPNPVRRTIRPLRINPITHKITGRPRQASFKRLPRRQCFFNFIAKALCFRHGVAGRLRHNRVTVYRFVVCGSRDRTCEFLDLYCVTAFSRSKIKIKRIKRKVSVLTQLYRLGFFGDGGASSLLRPGFSGLRFHQ